MKPDKVEVAIMLIIALFVGSIIWCAVYSIGERHRGYAAWVKLTDNPKNLTYDEWVALVNSTESSNSVIIIPISH